MSHITSKITVNLVFYKWKEIPKPKMDQVKIGQFMYYYENENKKHETNYYKYGLLGKDESWYESWYENGLKKIQGEYFEPKNGFSSIYKIKNFWNSKGIQTLVDQNGYFEDKTEDGFDSGNKKNGCKDVTWKGECNKKLKYTAEYEKEEFISGVSAVSVGKKYKYNHIEIKPEPFSGIASFYNHVDKILLFQKSCKT
jgi:hypothetical protein